MTPGQVQDDLARMDVGDERVDHLRQSVIGYAEHEQVTGARYLSGLDDRDAGQQGFRTHTGDVATGRAGYDLVPGSAQGRTDDSTGSAGADDADA